MEHITSKELLAKLTVMVDESNQKTVAEQLGITPAYLNDILWERRKISGTVATKLGYTLKTVYEPNKGRD